MPRLGALARRVYNPGVYESAEISIPVGLSWCNLALERNSWPAVPGVPRGVVDGVMYQGPDSEVVRVMIELSMDGGLTWGQQVREPIPTGGWKIFPTLVGFGAEGGDHFDGRGNLITEVRKGFELGEPTNPDRKGRLIMTVVVRLRTQLEVEVG